MKNIEICIACVWLVLTAAFIVPAAEEKDVVYASREQGFSIQYPANWESKENVSGAALALSAPSEGKSFRNNLTIIVHDLPKDATLATFSDAQVSGIDKMLDGYRRQEKAETDLGTLKAVRIVFQYAQKDTKVKCLCILTVANERGYIITCSADATKFDDAKKQFEQLIGTFKVL